MFQNVFFEQYLDDIKFNQMSFDIFTFLNNSFKYSFLISNESNIPDLLKFNNFFIEHHQIEIETFSLNSELNSLPNVLPIHLHPSIIQGMKLLRKDCKNQHFQKRAFNLFKSLADKGDPEASWRVAACYFRGWGVKKNKETGKKYSEVAISWELAEGYLWHGMLSAVNFNDETDLDSQLIIEDEDQEQDNEDDWISDYPDIFDVDFESDDDELIIDISESDNEEIHEINFLNYKLYVIYFKKQ